MSCIRSTKGECSWLQVSIYNISFTYHLYDMQFSLVGRTKSLLWLLISKQDFSLDIFLRQTWRDERLDHGLNQTMFLSNFVLDRIWMPDSYFVNAKQGSFHKVTTDNVMIMIKPGGMVYYNAR